MVVSGGPEAQKEYARKWVAARRANFFSDKECCDCGTTERLTLDHVDRDQKVSSCIWSWSAERREAEIAKCVIRCDPCHKAKTKREREYSNAILNDQQAAMIREEYNKGGVTQKQIAVRYGVSRQTIGDVLTGISWIDTPQ